MGSVRLSRVIGLMKECHLFQIFTFYKPFSFWKCKRLFKLIVQDNLKIKRLIICRLWVVYTKQNTGAAKKTASCNKTSGQDPKLTFLGRRQLATESFFFSRHMEKCGRQKVSITFFLCSKTQTKLFGCQFFSKNQNKENAFGAAMAIFLLTNKIKFKHADRSCETLW